MRPVRYIQFLLLLLMSFNSFTALKAQCNDGTCTTLITGYDNNTYTIGSGQKICITSTGVFTGTLTVQGTGQVCNNGKMYPASFTIKDQSIVNNYGLIITAPKLQVQSTAIINNYNIIKVEAEFIVNSTAKYLGFGTNSYIRTNLGAALPSPDCSSFATFTFPKTSWCTGEYLTASFTNPAIATAASSWEVTNITTNTTYPAVTGVSLSSLLGTPGTYKVKATIVTPSGCSGSWENPQQITVNPSPFINLSTVVNQCTKKVDLTVQGTSITSYSLDFNNNNVFTDPGEGTFTALPATYPYTYASTGNFPIKVKASNAFCNAEKSVSVDIYPLPVLSILGGNASICGGSSKTLTAQISNTLPGVTYTFAWAGPSAFSSTDQSILATNGGTYTVTATPIGMACLPVLTQNSTLTVLPLLSASTITASSIVPTSCVGVNDGKFTLTVSAAIASKGYSLNGSATLSNLTSQLIANLPAGNNTISIAFPATANTPLCQYNLVVNIPGNAPQLSTNSLPAKCSPLNSGQATVSVSGGLSPYTYNWTLVNSTTSLGTGTALNNIAAGNYQVKVTDSRNCIVTSNVMVNSMSINSDLLAEPLGACLNATVPAQLNSSLNPTGAVASPAFSYTWLYKNTTSQQYVTLPGASGNTAQVAAGDYRVNISETLSACTFTKDFTVALLPNITIDLNTVRPNCIGNTGVIDASVTGGNGNYVYTWTYSGTTTFSPPTTNYIDQAPAGNYTLTVNDNAGCSSSTNLSLTSLSNTQVVLTSLINNSVTTNLPTANTINIAGCNLALNASGGNAPYSFEWYKLVNYHSDPANTAPHPILVISHYGTVPNYTATNYFNSNVTYQVYAIDANGCKSALSNISLNIADPGIIPFCYNFSPNPQPETPTPTSDPEYVDNITDAQNSFSASTQRCMQQKETEFKTNIKTNCFSAAAIKDKLTLSYTLSTHHYTLYYYDRAGRLTKTVPPEGVTFLSQTQVDAIIKYRADATPPAGNVYLPSHKMETKYFYNNIGQLIKQITPDGGDSRFIYDDLGRLRLSQNEQQRQSNKYSYTKYDALGRIAEVGESNQTATPAIDFNNTGAASNISLVTNNINFPNNISNNSQVTTTYYTAAAAGITYYGQAQRFLQNRVSYVTVDEDGNSATTSDLYATYYSYDPHGNVEWIIQEDPVLGKNFMAYEYDLISGKVLKVRYNENRADRFFHQYKYDTENRIVGAQTSRDGVLWEEDANYEYYAHGPLKRKITGDDHVQGTDYVYTIQGWLKGINSPNLNLTNNFDPGADGTQTTNTAVANDVYGMQLGYFDGDYVSTQTKAAYINNAKTLYASSLTKNLYNGNISHWVNSQVDCNAASTTFKKASAATASLYRYDVLNRIKQSAELLQPVTPGSTTAWTAQGNNFRTNYKYDNNGNILALGRYNSAAVQTDSIQYAYDVKTYLDNTYTTNKLGKVKDLTADPTAASGRNDLLGEHLYEYDKIGNLTKETAPELITTAFNGNVAGKYTVVTSISWNVYGKIKEVNKAVYTLGTTTGTPLKISRIGFNYDAGGQRVSKKVYTDANFNQSYEETEIKTQYYVRDAQGNALAVYSRENTSPSAGNYTAAFKLIERGVFGSDRLGEDKPDLAIDNINYTGTTAPKLTKLTDALPLVFSRNMSKQYEFNDHLGNVRAVVSDFKIATTDASFNVSKFTSDLQSTTDYYAFGGPMPGRQYNTTGYRYGFNGKEKIDEFSVDGGDLDFGARIYDSRLGRFLSTDPFASSFAFQSPYLYASNCPIAKIDKNGEFAQWIIQYGVNVGINAMTQMITAYMFDPNVKSWGDAWEEVSMFDAFGEGAVDMLGTKKLQMAANAVMGIASYVNKVGMENVTAQGLISSGLMGLLEPVLGDAVAKYGTKAFSKGLAKLGLSSSTIFRLTNEYVCFAAGTLVETINGKIPIEKITIGETVLSFNEETKSYEFKKVKNTFIKTTLKVCKIVTEQDELFTTPEHLFYVNGNWVEAKELRSGDKLKGLNGDITIKTILIIDSTITVYNFEVEDNHNYCVGKETILAHNLCASLDWTKSTFGDASRKALRESFGKAAKGLEAHHIIPVSLAKKLDFVQKGIKGGFQFSTAEFNGVLLDKATHRGELWDHPEYSKYIANQLQILERKWDGTEEGAATLLNKFSQDIKKVIENMPKGVTLDEFFGKLNKK